MSVLSLHRDSCYWLSDVEEGVVRQEVSLVIIVPVYNLYTICEEIVS